jgi:hypothetical protein
MCRFLEINASDVSPWHVGVGLKALFGMGGKLSARTGTSAGSQQQHSGLQESVASMAKDAGGKVLEFWQQLGAEGSGGDAARGRLKQLKVRAVSVLSRMDAYHIMYLRGARDIVGVEHNEQAERLGPVSVNDGAEVLPVLLEHELAISISVQLPRDQMIGNMECLKCI